MQFSFDNIKAPKVEGYGVDHVNVAEALVRKAICVRRQGEINPAIARAEQWMAAHRVPVVIEIIRERVTHNAMGTEIDNVVKFEERAVTPAAAPTAVALLD